MWFKKYDILIRIPSLYILVLAKLVINKFSYFNQFISALHKLETKNFLHEPPIFHLFKNSAKYVFNIIPLYIKKLIHDKMQFMNTFMYFLFI
jgi:hypothetical protein